MLTAAREIGYTGVCWAAGRSPADRESTLISIHSSVTSILPPQSGFPDSSGSPYFISKENSHVCR